MCEEARSSVDYLEFCKIFKIIILRDIPFIDIKKNSDSLRRFIVFIDNIYDNKVKLIFSGKASSPQLLFNLSNFNNVAKSSFASFEEEVFAIDRTISRLIEMQSETYLNLLNK